MDDYLDQDYLDNLARETELDDSEGQLSVDVIETKDEIIIRSAIAGISVEDLDISVTADTVTIRGQRELCDKWYSATVHVEECFWGKFSRSVILPQNVKPDEADAVLKNGILTITLKKAEMSNQLSVLDLD